MPAFPNIIPVLPNVIPALLNVIPAKAGIHQITHINQLRAMKHYYIYIMASKRNGTLYVGVTDNLTKRVYQHKNGLIDGFTKRYNVHMLVYFEETPDVSSAILREKQLKKWKRQWKIELIEKLNPQWKNLYYELTESGFPLSLINQGLPRRFLLSQE